MTKRRTERLNSLLKEVISDVIKRQVRHPDISELLTVTRVDITNDLHHAKVYVSVIGDEEEKHNTLRALQASAGFIAVNASKQMVIRYFPELTFKLDDSVDKQMRIAELLEEVNTEQRMRKSENLDDEVELS